MELKDGWSNCLFLPQVLTPSDRLDGGDLFIDLAYCDGVMGYFSCVQSISFGIARSFRARRCRCKTLYSRVRCDQIDVYPSDDNLFSMYLGRA